MRSKKMVKNRTKGKNFEKEKQTKKNIRNGTEKSFLV